jgi:prepilin-type N-terminal cleavage/methylation domain-containing protein
MNKHKPYRDSGGFTIVELLVVIVVIGILAAVTVFAYNGITKRAIDSSLAMDAQQTQTGLNSYAVDNNGTYVAWTSGTTAPAGLSVPGGSKNSIDVSVSTDKKSYCIRVYNSSSSYSSLATAYSLGSSGTACQNLGPSLANTNNQWVSVSAGNFFTCALAVNGYVYCWGYNSGGELGINSTTSSPVPMPLYVGGELAGKGIKKLDSGGSHSCVIASDDKVYCWGSNASGSLGNGVGSTSYPTAVSTSGVMNGKSITAIEAGPYFMCATDTDGKMYCWGENDNKQLGNNLLTNSPIPVIASAWGTLDTRSVATANIGNDHICVIASGTTYCYGDNGSGQSGTATSSYTSSAINISSLAAFSGKTITDIESMGDHTCALTDNNQLYCFGTGANGELGNGANGTINSTPSAVNASGALAGKTILSGSITGSYSNTCILTTDTGINAVCWGSGSNGMLGNNSTTSSNVPVAVNAGEVPAGVSFKSLSTGSSHNCAVATNQKIYCWGWNAFGQLGNEQYITSPVPVQAIPNL